MPRLIDADAFLKDILTAGIGKTIIEYSESDIGYMIRKRPTVDAVPVRHGYWENANGRPKTYIRKCSVCGKEAYFCGRGCSYKFCPNCGAKMEGESDE